MNYHFCKIKFFKNKQTVYESAINAEISESNESIIDRSLARLKKDHIELKFDYYEIERTLL